MKKTAKNRFVFTPKMAAQLRQLRGKAGLTQTEVAERIGMSSTSGDISHLERGIIQNPPLGTILLYLSACGIAWREFFAKLETQDFQARHQKVISRVKLPDGKERKKIERDVAWYQAGIKYLRKLTQKPLSSRKQETMVLRFAQYRTNIERMEAAVHKILCDLAPGTYSFPFYKDCARAFFAALVKYYGKDIRKLNQKFADIIKLGVVNGLKEKILLKILGKVVSVFESQIRILK
jgi:transcriptional regulator with XRE-family HTH domain